LICYLSSSFLFFKSILILLPSRPPNQFFDLSLACDFVLHRRFPGTLLVFLGQVTTVLLEFSLQFFFTRVFFSLSRSAAFPPIPRHGGRVQWTAPPALSVFPYPFPLPPTPPCAFVFSRASVRTPVHPPMSSPLFGCFFGESRLFVLSGLSVDS